MNKEILIKYKNKNILIDALLKNENIVDIKNQNFLKRINFIKDKTKVDVYFHSGNIDKESIKNINNAKKTIVSSNIVKKELIDNHDINLDKIEVLYPSINPYIFEKIKICKREFLKKYNIDEKRKIIFFTAKNLKKAGILEFIQIVMSLSFRNIQVIIACDEKQLENLKFQLSSPSIFEKILFITNTNEIENIFCATDVFLLPTNNQTFSTNILKAMYYKCAVFTTVLNHSSEIIDTFSTMSSSNDASIIFKIDALLNNENDLKVIKKQNRKLAKRFLLDNKLTKVYEIIDSV